MSWLLGALGALLVGGALIDAVLHTVALRGGGPLARRLGNLLWRAILQQRRMPWFDTLSALGGPIILLLTFLVWSLMLWIGWSLIFSADPTAIVKGATQLPADGVDRAYYAGFVITTLGIGDFEPRTELFQILSVLAAGMGFSLITLFVTYLLSVLAAVVFKRSLALDVLGLAESPEKLVIEAWRSDRFETLAQYYLNNGKDWVTLSQQHLAYPALHFFRTRHRSGSPSVAAALVDDSLTLLECAVAPDHRPNPLVLRSVRHGIGQLAESVASSAERQAPIPPAPSLAALRDAGVPTVDDATFEKALHELAERRATLHGLLHFEGRDWGAVTGD